MKKTSRKKQIQNGNLEVFYSFYQISDHAYQWNYNIVENMM